MRIMLAAAFAATITGTTAANADVWLRSGGVTSTPYGHHHYCQNRPRDCGAMRAAAPERLTSGKLAMLKRVNNSVNRSIVAKSDQDAFGKTEHWAYPARVGDCEEFALAKRARLIGAGFRPANLKLTMSRLPWGEAHAVLVVRTDAGDFVLDNLTNQILPVSKARMRFVKMQSSRNAADWVRISGKTRNMPV